ncbi:MAG: DEAD/DEAH box helicase, partial [Clostridia bacterium]|nr:DEAD/DEAH box helicase [Clostridia bacterium]
SGKTQTALQIAAEIGLPTLWITHTRDLLTQAKDRALDNMPGICTGEISEGCVAVGRDITFATVQTLVGCVDEESIARDRFGLVIVDECHRVCVSAESVGQFQRCINYFSARYKIGLTATPHRADGLIDGMFRVIGGTIYELQKDLRSGCFIGRIGGQEVCRVPVEQFQTPVTVQVIHTGYNIRGRAELFDPDGGTVIYSRLITSLGEDDTRERITVDLLLEERGHYTLVLSDRVEHLERMREALRRRGERSAAVLTGKTKKVDRDRFLRQMRDGDLHYLFSSYKLAKEGLDIPRLDRLVLASPNKDEAIIVQSLGRIQRPFPGKERGIVYDLVDDVGVLQGMARKRLRIYRENGIEAKEK